MYCMGWVSAVAKVISTMMVPYTSTSPLGVTATPSGRKSVGSKKEHDKAARRSDITDTVEAGVAEDAWECGVMVREWTGKARAQGDVIGCAVTRAGRVCECVMEPKTEGEGHSANI